MRAKESYEIELKVPEEFAGEVMGKITALGIFVDSVETSESIWTIRAGTDTRTLVELKHWLRRHQEISTTLEIVKTSEP